MIELLDSNWISTILSIAFTLVIFILGIPLLFIQTYVPENLRKYYLELPEYKSQVHLFKWIFLFLIAFILIFGNQGMRYFFSVYCCYDNDGNCIECQSIIIAYYFVCLFIFLGLTIFSYTLFRKNTEKRLKVKQLILEYNFGRLSHLMNREHKMIEVITSCKPMINDFYYFYSEGIDKRSFFQHLYSFLFGIIRSESYTGKEIMLLIEDIFLDNYVHNYTERSNYELDKLVSFSVALSKKNCSTFDQTFFSDILIKQIAQNIIKSHTNIHLYTSAIKALRSLSARQTVFFDIYYVVFKAKYFTFLEQECIYLKMLIENSVGKNLNQFQKAELKEITNNLCAYVSWMYISSKSAREKYLSIYIESGLLTVSAFQSAILRIIRLGKYDTADIIRVLMSEVFE